MTEIKKEERTLEALAMELELTMCVNENKDKGTYLDQHASYFEFPEKPFAQLT